MNFGENLKIFRKNSKLSQEELADKVGVSRQSVSKWEVGDAYPEMTNIIALCSIFHCNINDLINNNIVDIESFDKETQEGIVKFKKDQQKRMKGISKTIYIITKIVEIVLITATIALLISCIVLPFISNTFSITDNKINILNKSFDYSIDGNILNINGSEYFIESTSNIKSFISNHDSKFFVYSFEYILICLTSITTLIALGMHYLSKLYKNIYNESTPFTIDNEKLVKLACLMFLIGMILVKVTAIIYSVLAHIDLSIDINLTDVILLLIGISMVYIFKYGRMIQADTKAKIYD